MHDAWKLKKAADWRGPLLILTNDVFGRDGRVWTNVGLDGESIAFLANGSLSEEGLDFLDVVLAVDAIRNFSQEG